MIVCGEFDEALAEVCARKKVAELELNWANGFKGDNLSFLQNLPFLTSFTICDYNIKDISGVHYLVNLRHLKISTYCKTALDFSVFKNLEDLSLFWRPKTKVLSNCDKLKKLFIYKYNPQSKDLSGLSGLGQLRNLSLKMPTLFSLNGISSLDSLAAVGIYGATKLVSIEGLAELKGLKELALDCCKRIDDLGEIARLENLESLSVSNAGKIKTLSHLTGLKKLAMFNFVESTNVADGNLEFLKALPKLREISYQNRAHYNLKREELWKITDKKDSTL